MNVQQIQIAAGAMATLIFVSSNLPMLWKVLTTKSLRSYSFSHIALCNVGNVLHWLYVTSLPIGPVWLLHGFNTAVALLMLVCYLRYEKGRNVLLPIEGGEASR